MNRGRSLAVFVFVGLTSLVGCAPQDSDESRAAAIIAGTPVTTDPAGYAFLVNGDVMGSGIFLAPNWVLTAGHLLADNDGAGRWSFANPPMTSVEVGTTTNGFQGTPYVHPRWWGALGHPPPPLGLRDWAYDVGLVHLNSAYANTAGYSDKLFNQLSNDWVQSTVRCFGYGQTNLNGTGGGAGKLQTADFDVTGYQINPGQGIPDPVGPSSVEMITVADSASGQRLFHGDSGGTCTNLGRSPYVIAGINESFKDNGDGTHTTFLVDPWNIKYWVDATMHGPYPGPSAAPGPSLGFTSAATKTGFTGTFIGNHRNFIVSTSSKTSTANMVVNSASGWSSWGALSAFPSLGGLKPSHGLVGITSILDGAGEARILMAVIAANENGSNVYVSPILIPDTATPWPTFTWTNAGSPPAGNKWKSTPAIVAVGPVTTSRTDYFAYASNTSDSNGAIYYRWKFNGSWKNSSWTQIPQPPNGVTIKSSPSAALHGTTLYLAARGSDGAMWFNTLPNVTDSGTYGGPWTGWASLGGVWVSPPALTAWDRGVDLYGLGSDNTLYHMTMDGDGLWSDYMQVSPTAYPTALVTAQNLLPSTHEIDILTVSGQTPSLTRFPW